MIWSSYRHGRILSTRFISRYAYRVSAADGTGDGHDLTVAAFPFIALRDGKSTDISGCVEEVSPLGLPVAEAAEVMCDGAGRYGFFTGKALHRERRGSLIRDIPAGPRGPGAYEGEAGRNHTGGLRRSDGGNGYYENSPVRLEEWMD
ncbi:MAG: hypothetical protein MZV70_01195 [Desulfobacterales bacterium]|nr:hypothetical protein [Desulfobacterales bacterium]